MRMSYWSSDVCSSDLPSARGRSSMTAVNHQYIAEQFLTSLVQFQQLLPAQLSEQVSILGKDGSPSMTDLIDTLMRWYDTSPTKDKEKMWTLILDFFMLPTVHGIPSRGSIGTAHV